MDYPKEEQKYYEHYRYIAEPGITPVRVDKFLMQKHQNASRSKIQSAAEAGFIHVNGKSVKSNYKVKPNDIVALVLDYPKKEFELIPQDIPLEVVYEDEDLLVINKQPGMVVHPSYGHYSGTLMNALAHYFKDNPYFNEENGDVRPGLIHRIDKNTSGLLVIAKNDIAKTKLSAQFADKTSTRKYVAVVWGNLEEKEGTIRGNIGRNIRDRKVMAVFPEGNEYGKHAVTHYKVIEPLGYVNVVECVLETGRTHQIRAHFQHIGHPLFNDWEYGGDRILKGTTFSKYKQFIENCFKICPRHALHAKTLGFIHPRTNEYIDFNSPLPEDMTALIEKWRVYTSARDDI
ncbi:RluA family pseudouridine synthase [Balneicella halophila]|uniref:Pseudouridine synthase n=1 Tax=Balneicella halophila TaxID=1537566 RepID=A0A7L4URU1_BALHA|nr:RluA family pseudouridine synthase [Balneicella halophila]PVX52473.1 RluA family pseudouridine synthase [Balneicella halophila]